MSRMVALGERRRLDGYLLAGVEMVGAESADEVRAPGRRWTRR